MLGGLAAAAGLTMAVGVARLVEHEPTVVEGPPSVRYLGDIESLIGESRRLEQVLSVVDRNGRVVDGLTASAIADLEDRIALVDIGIERARAAQTSSRAVASLWRQRVALMDALLAVHVGRVTYEGF